jgi:hypothetical protein
MGGRCSPIFFFGLSMSTQPTDAPDNDLARDVYAHFGLCMYIAQVFETGLINILTVLENSKSDTPTEENFDRLYKQHEALTFGNLMNALSKHNFVPQNLMQEARYLKEERDHLAHRFFRDHVLDMATVSGCNLMIEVLTDRRERFSALDRKISELLDKVYEQRLGDGMWQKKLDEISHEMRIEARERALRR